MSPFSTSDSKRFTWGRLRREVGRVFLLLICLELLCRLEPVHHYLSQTLDSYENLLWYDPGLPSYQIQLEQHPDYALWLVGSSYMMTGLNPAAVQQGLSEEGLPDMTAQNYGMNRMMDFSVMSQVFDRWMFNLEQPRYIVIGISQRNFTTAASIPPPILTSPYENMTIFPHTVDNYVTGFLYQNSLFYHYTVLARNALLIPRDETIRTALPDGGFVERPTSYDCSLKQEDVDDSLQPVSDMDGGLARLDRFLDVIRAHNIQAMVVNIPMPLCTIAYEGFKDFDDYETHYLNPLAQHLQAENIAFEELDSRFQAEVAATEQPNYFSDSAHPNSKGAALFSQWTSEFIATWLKSLPTPAAPSNGGN